MGLTSQSTRPPNPPTVPSSASHLSYEYPSQAQSVTDRVPRATRHGLGIYQQSMTQSNSQQDDAMALLPSSATSQWPTSAFRDAENLYASPSNPDQYLVDFVPSIPSSFSQPISSDSCALSRQFGDRGTSSPFGSYDNSQRSSISSAALSETFAYVESTPALHSQAKMEESSRWPSGLEFLPGGSYPQQMLERQERALAFDYGSADSHYRSDASPQAWLKIEGNHGSRSPKGGVSYHERATSFDSASSQSKAARRSHDDGTPVRPQRRLTSKEDANFQCAIRGCGKLFSRSYNYKAHMETHDTGRVYPFPCPIEDCNKQFVRKTDLQRHHQSVHEKQRNHQCDFCNKLFARKDTLRRYKARSGVKRP